MPPTTARRPRRGEKARPTPSSKRQPLKADAPNSSPYSSSSESTVPDLDSFEVDKHRDYKIHRGNQGHSVEQASASDASPPSDHAGTDDDDDDEQSNMTDEQRAWAGIDEILADGSESVYPGNLLAPEIMQALQRDNSQASEGPYIDDDDDGDSDEDSHDHAMKMLCGYNKAGAEEDLPFLMNSSFSSLSSHVSQESAISVLSYLSKKNIIVQRDMAEGPLKDFLTEMAMDLEENANDEQKGESDDAPSRSEENGAENHPTNPQQDTVKEEIVLDAIGQQIVDAIMSEMRRMKESNEYDEDDDDDGEEFYEDQDYEEEEEDAAVPESIVEHRATRQVAKARKEPNVDPREPDLNECESIPEENLHDSIPSVDTFQDDEVTKILDHQDPTAWSYFGDLTFDSSHTGHPPTLPQSPFGEQELQNTSPPRSPARRTKGEIASGLSRVPKSPKEPGSPSRGKRVSKPSTNKKTKQPEDSAPASPQKPSERRQSAGRRSIATESSARRPSTSRSKNPRARPKVVRKSLSRPAAGATSPPKTPRKPIKRSDANTATPPKITRKVRPPESPTKPPKPMESRQSATARATQPPPQRKKPDVRSSAKRCPSEKGKPSTSSSRNESDQAARRSLVRTAQPNMERKASQSGSTSLRSSQRTSRPVEGQSPSRSSAHRKKKIVKGRPAVPSEDGKRRPVRKPRRPSAQ